MDHHRRAIRMGAAVLVLAISLRLFGGGIFQPLDALWEHPALMSFLIYLQSGRVVRYPTADPAPTVPTVPTTLPPAPTVPKVPDVPVFSQSDLVEVHYSCDYRPALETLLLSPLSWELRGETPRVLILHTHATEGYTQTANSTYEETEPFRTLDEQNNMLAIGDEVARILEENGIGVIHDRTVHDYPSYNDSYENARQTIQRHLRENPEICLVLDIHRDASDLSAPQFATQGTVDGVTSAQLMMVVGTDATGNYHPNWQENLALALKLSAVLEREDPGLTRPISLREHRFNMDLTPGSLIVEVGSAGNTLDEALLAAQALAQGVLRLAGGA